MTDSRANQDDTDDRNNMNSPTDTPPTDREGTGLLGALKLLWRFTGPGVMISTAFLSTGSLEADVEAGAEAKHKLLWLGLLSAVLGIILQRLSARLGVASRRHLADHCTTFYCRAPRVFKWVLMELSILSCDMQNVIGMSVGLFILFRTYIPLYAGVLLSFVETVGLLLLDKYGPQKLQALFAVFILVIAVTFGYEYLTVLPDQSEVLRGIVVPSCEGCSKDIYIQTVSIVGSSLSPHNLFLHSGLVKDAVEKSRMDLTDETATKRIHRVLFIELTIAIMVSYMFNVFVTSVIGSTVFGQSNAQLRELCLTSGSPFANVFPNDTDNVHADLYTGGVFLGCQYGSVALSMWAVGVLAASLAGTLHGSRAGRFIMEGFLRRRWSHWQRAVVVRSLSATPLLFVALFSDIRTFLAINSALNLVLHLHLPAAALPTIALTANRSVMGVHVSSKFSTASSLLLTSGVVAANVYMLVRLVWDELPSAWGWVVGAVLLGLGYLAHIVYLLLDMASSSGHCDALAGCKLGQRYLNQPYRG